jgi:hypothetical protein
MSSSPPPPAPHRAANDGTFLARFVEDAAQRDAAAAKCRRDAALDAQRAALVRQKQAAAAAAALRRSTAAAASISPSTASALPVDAENATGASIACEQEPVGYQNETLASEPSADLLCTLFALSSLHSNYSRPSTQSTSHPDFAS